MPCLWAEPVQVGLGIIWSCLTSVASQELSDLQEKVIRENPGSLGVINNKALNPEDPINAQCVFKSIKV